MWSRDACELFYSNDGQLWAVEIATEPTLNWKDPVALFEAPWPLYIPLFVNYDVTSDGQRFLFVCPEEESEDESYEIRAGLNWFEEVKERGPIP